MAGAVAFMKAKHSLVGRRKEKYFNSKKKKKNTEDGKNLKPQLIDFGYHRKVAGLTKLFIADLLSNVLHEKVLIFY